MEKSRHPQINIRLKPELKELLHAAALKSKESVNSEIVSRLEMSLLADQPSTDSLNAEQAKSLAVKARGNICNALFNLCVDEINKNAKIGIQSATVETPYFSEADLDQGSDAFKDVILPVINQLTELGYSAGMVDHKLVITF